MSHTRPPATPGQIALSIMGWLELSISVILFVLQVTVAAAAFGLAALFLTFVATQVRRQRNSLRQGRVDNPARRQVGPAFWVQLATSAVLIVAGVVFFALGRTAFAVNFVIWGLVLGLFAERAAQPT